jgi:site-specific recombinase XerD
MRIIANLLCLRGRKIATIAIARKLLTRTYHLLTDMQATDLGHCVPHQARHTLATSLLRHGATLTRAHP